jgi:hypothetical protein
MLLFGKQARRNFWRNRIGSKGSGYNDFKKIGNLCMVLGWWYKQTPSLDEADASTSWYCYRCYEEMSWFGAEGRMIIVTNLKYVYMTTSAKLWYIFRTAGTYLLLPILLLLVIANRVLSDMHEMTISTDTIEAEMVEKPRKSDIRFIP